MKKYFLSTLLAALTIATQVEARQIIDKTNNFFINLPDRFLLEPNKDTENKFVVLNAFDPEDEATFIIKISPSQISEISGMALDNERTKFRDSLIKMGLEPYVEGILHIAPNHESIYTFSKLEDQGEVLNYLMAKFWAHNKEYSFFCIQPTKTLKTQEFIDSVDSFICTKHQNYTLPYPQRKERPEYDKAKDAHDNLVKKTDLEVKKLIAEGKQEEADKLLATVPKFEEKPAEYIPIVEINGMMPLPLNITDKVAHDALYSEHPEEVYAKAKGNSNKLYRSSSKNNYGDTTTQTKVQNPATKDTPPAVAEQTPAVKETPGYITPPPIKRNAQGRIVIRDGKASQEFNYPPQQKQPERKLSKEEQKQLEKMKKEKAKFEREQAKRQAKLEKMRQKEIEREKRRMEKELEN